MIPQGPAPREVSRSADPTPDRLDRPFEDPLFERLFPPLPAGVHWGLERVRNALAALGDPQARIPWLHVGGTNGKGSVASTAASVLGAAGRRVGLYTSPHLCSMRERFQVDGRPVEESALVSYADEIRDVVSEHGLTFFEAATVLAFHAFAGEEAGMGVAEVGLGGRLDATNVLEPQACAITNVAMDHADFLGDTLPQIAREKAGIIKHGVPVVVSENAPELVEVFRRVAHGLGAPLVLLDPDRDLTRVEVARDHTTLVLQTGAWGELRLTTPLVGRHQAANAALAVKLLEQLPGRLLPEKEAVESGVAGVRWPGRDQIESVDGTTWLLDVAHNTAGVTSLTSVLDRLDLPRPRVGLIGVLGDKDWTEMLPPLLRRLDTAVLTQPDSAPVGRRWDPAEARATVEALPGGSPCPLALQPDFAAALDEARSRAGRGTVVVTGSCHTVGDALRGLGRVPFEGDSA